MSTSTSFVSMLKAPGSYITAPTFMENYVNTKAVSVIKKSITTISPGTARQQLTNKLYSTMDLLKMVDAMRVDSAISGKLTIADCKERLAIIKTAGHVLSSMSKR